MCKPMIFCCEHFSFLNHFLFFLEFDWFDNFLAKEMTLFQIIQDICCQFSLEFMDFFKIIAFFFADLEAEENEDEDMEEEELILENGAKDPRAGNVSVTLPQLKADFNQLADHLFQIG